jgi:hypothetical protein
MADFRDKARQMSMEYRDFWAENAELGMAMGFVPVVGQVLGIADALAAHNDERASELEKGLATAGVLPLGKVVGALKTLATGKGAAGPMLGMVLGPYHIKKVEEAGRAGELVGRHIDPRTGVETAEMVNRGTIKGSVIEQAQKGPQVGGRASEMLEGDVLAEIDPDYANMTTIAHAGRSLGHGEFRPPGAGGKGAALGVGTGVPYSGRLSRADAESLASIVGHERKHYIDARDIAAGNRKTRTGGSHPEVVGWHRYAQDTGEIDARLDEFRWNWDPADMESLKPWEHDMAYRKMMEDNVLVGRTVSENTGRLNDPDFARAMYNRAEREGIHPGLERSAKRGAANWEVAVDPKKREWAEQMTAKQLLDLEPRLGQKFDAIFDENGLTATYQNRSKSPRYAKNMMLDEKIPAVRAKVRFNETTGTWDVEELDGLRRTLASRNMFGPDAKVPVIFEPVDDVSRVLAKDPNYLSLDVRPKADLLEADRKKFATAAASALQGKPSY